jgi:hypothetical protein
MFTGKYSAFTEQLKTGIDRNEDLTKWSALGAFNLLGSASQKEKTTKEN